MLTDAMEAQGEAQIEKLFECLGTVKEVVESCSGDVLKEDTGPFLQHILLTYDLPCSLQLCRILSNDTSSDNAHRIKTMAERALMIDSENQEANEFMREA